MVDTIADAGFGDEVDDDVWLKHFGNSVDFFFAAKVTFHKFEVVIFASCSRRYCFKEES